MADRTSAALFGEIFELLASDEPIDRATIARRMWDKSGGYDFSPYQMSADDALMKLGLAHECKDCKAIVYDDDEHDPRDCEDNR